MVGWVAGGRDRRRPPPLPRLSEALGAAAPPNTPTHPPTRPPLLAHPTIHPPTHQYTHPSINPPTHSPPPPPCTRAQLYPGTGNPTYALVSDGGRSSITGTYGQYLVSLEGSGGSGPTPFQFTCPGAAAGELITQIKVAGVDVAPQGRTVSAVAFACTVPSTAC